MARVNTGSGWTATTSDDTELVALASTTSAANQIPYFTGSGTASTVDRTTDWLAQYALLAGRATTQTLTGGTGGTGSLILQGDSAATTSGTINLRSPVRLRDLTTETLTAETGPLLLITGTRTLDFPNASFGGVASSPLIGMNGTLQFNQSGAADSCHLFGSGAVFTNVSGVAANVGSCGTFVSRPTYQADGAVISLQSVADYNSVVRFRTINGGTLNPGSDYVNYEAQYQVLTAGITVGSVRSFAVVAPTGAGVIGQYNPFMSGPIGAPIVANATGLKINALTTTGTNIGVDVDLPSGGTTNIGVRSAGSILHTGTTGLGYGVGAGGAVTQLTSRTTTVILNKVCGAITLFAAAGTAAWTSFTVTNSTVAATDVVDMCVKSATNTYSVMVSAVAAGSFAVTFSAVAGTASDSPVFNFCVTKAGVT